MKAVLEKTKSYVVEELASQVIRWSASSSNENLIKTIGILQKMSSLLGGMDERKEQLDYFKKLIIANHPFSAWVKRINGELNSHCRDVFFKNLIIKNYFIFEKKRKEFMQREGFKGPTNIVVSPTIRCNLRCKGCWAGEFQKVPDMEMEILERIVEEARDELGINFITITGGEPFIRKDLLSLYEKYPDVQFHIYTNGTLIDEEVAKRLRELGNVMPMVSVEGGEEETDARRGKGIYRKVMKAMDNLKEEGVFFGFSIATTKYNVKEATSDEFIDNLIKKGCLNGWYFQYIPIGRNPDTSLMLTPQQRDYSRRRVYKLRNTKPILLADFWNDGPAAHGCMAGGKQYLHINALGDIEPCVFAQFAVDNIRDKTITEALKSPFFKAIRDGIPYDGNPLRPCMVVDRPEYLRNYVKKYGAYPTYPKGECLFSSPVKDGVDEYAKGVKEIYDKAWKENDWKKFFNLDYLE